jgi:hypothetical protein
VDARLRLGVNPFPFQAHAWVEYRGIALNEDAELLRFYSTFPPLGLEHL